MKTAKTPEKIDLYKQHAAEYVAPKKPTVIKTKPAMYLAIEGQGAPGGEKFANCTGALYAMAYTIKMTSKFAGKDYKVCPLEGLYWGDIPNEWHWKLLIRTPDFVTPGDLDQAAATLSKKGKPPEFEQVRLERLEEGRVVQMLHVGPYDEEPKTVKSMAAFAAA